MSKKALVLSAPIEVIQLLDTASADTPRTKFSIKLLRHFFKENPTLTDMSGLLSQEVIKFTFRLPDDLLDQLENFAQRYGYPRHTAILVAIMAAARDLGLTQRTAAQPEK